MKLSLTCAAAVAAAASLATGAQASAPAHSTGTGILDPPILTNVHMADGNVVADFAQTGMVAGTFTGTISATGAHLIVHPDGSANVDGFATFVGMTPCGPGTLVFQVSDRTIAGVGSGRSTTVDAATNTADIESTNVLTLAGLTFTYDGIYTCGG